MISDRTNQSKSLPRTERAKIHQLGLLADYLETFRETTEQRSKLTDETKRELEECLTLAEAALRRAHFESQL